ncbi:MAG: DUF4279 domain-containing protein [Parachlamydiaceae bacterium]|nr:DUF4279 domain-containing protein [Parachlamydiaceae bacterium]
MRGNEGRVYFCLFGDDFDPNEVTEFLGINPTSIQIKGERVPNIFPKESSWMLSTDNIVNDLVDVYTLATSIVNDLKSKKDLIIEAKKKFNVFPMLQVVLWFSLNEEDSTPVIGFEADTIKFLGEIGAFIDIDTYRRT